MYIPNAREFNNAFLSVDIFDTETLEAYTIDKELWEEIKKELNIDETSEDIMEKLRDFWDSKCGSNCDVSIIDSIRR